MILIILVSLIFINSDPFVIIYKKSDNIREIANRYLGNSDDWELILKYNNYLNINQLKEGSTLLIPIKEYKQFIQKDSEYNILYQKVLENGAYILLKDSILKTDKIYQEAIDLKRDAKLLSGKNLLKKAMNKLIKINRLTEEKRIKSVTAVMEDKRGLVKSKKPSYRNWLPVKLKDELIEKEHVRTYEKSFGQILFIDGSRIQLGENALTVLEKLNEDIIREKRETKLVVLQGDLTTYLKVLDKRNQVNVELPGVKTNIRSQNFWTERNSNSIVRFSNYDGEIDLMAAGSKIILKKNQGSKILPGRSPSKAKNLLNAPTMINQDELIRKETFKLSWKPVKGAKYYKLQEAERNDFSYKLKQYQLASTSKVISKRKSGEFYYRVSAIDNDGLPGPFSKLKRISLLIDNSKPYIRFEKDYKNLKTGKDEIEFKGEISPKATLQINGVEVKNSNGSFAHKVKLNKGKQEIRIHLTGVNLKVINETFFIEYIPMSENLWLDLPDPAYINTDKFILNGRSKINGVISINDSIIHIHNNSFSYIYQLKKGPNRLELKSNGQVIKTVNIIYDNVKPDIDIMYQIKQDQLFLSLKTNENCNFSINDAELVRNKKQYDYRYSLKTGMNRFILSAYDLAGNRSEKILLVPYGKSTYKIKGIELTKKRLDKQNYIHVKVSVLSKYFELKRLANARLTVGSNARKIMLERNESGGMYEAWIPISNNEMTKKININDIQLSTY